MGSRRRIIETQSLLGRDGLTAAGATKRQLEPLDERTHGPAYLQPSSGRGRKQYTKRERRLAANPPEGLGPDEARDWSETWGRRTPEGSTNPVNRDMPLPEPPGPWFAEDPTGNPVCICPSCDADPDRHYADFVGPDWDEAVLAFDQLNPDDERWRSRGAVLWAMRC